jgi:redox-sensitive bicupin YhaK (pirin superfamily)
MGGHAGPFKTVTPVQMIDFELAAGASVAHEVTAGLDTCLVYVYEGSGQVSGDHPLTEGSVAVLDATKEDTRSVQLKSGESGLKALLFAGKRLNEPIAWHGPIVMNTQRQIHETFDALQRGEFPPKRVPWDYKKASAAPNRQG